MEKSLLIICQVKESKGKKIISLNLKENFKEISWILNEILKILTGFFISLEKSGFSILLF